MPRCGDLAILVTTTDNRQTKPIALLLAHVRRVITGMMIKCSYSYIQNLIEVIDNDLRVIVHLVVVQA